ncbi:MAG TPA: ABC transporter permease [Vicinamibacterales bacterium]|nr:ABC transporter permease [Vicinamibacterales bacterium]
MTTLGDLWRDVRFGARLIRRSPMFATFVVVALGLGVGANATVFTLVNAIWLEPRAVADPDNVVVVTRHVRSIYADRLDEEALNRFRALPIFEGVAAQVAASSYWRLWPRAVDLDRSTEFLAVTDNYFRVLGLPVHGRDFEPADDVRGAPAVAVISDQLWHSTFGGRAEILGSTFETEREPVTIIGIAPPGFRGARLGELVDVWIPRAVGLRMTSSAHRTGTVLRFRNLPVVVLARLRPGVSAVDAFLAVGAVGPSRYRLLPLPSVVGGPGRVTTTFGDQRVWPLVGATAGLVLLAGSATLAALVVAQLERRRRELIVRLALGAGRARLVRMVLAEFALPAIAGVGLALLVADWTLAASRRLTVFPGVTLDRLDLSLDLKIVGVGLMLGIGTMVVAALVGLRPFARLTASNVVVVNAATTSSRSSVSLRRGLLVLHVAVTVVVLIGGALLVRTITQAVAPGAGFDAAHTLFVSVEPSRTEFYDPVTNPRYWEDDGPKRAAYESLMAGIRALPRVRMVALGEAPIRITGFEGSSANALRLDAGDGARAVVLGWRRAGAGYLEALGVPLLAGQAETPEATDRIITRSLARLFWPDGSAVGQYVTELDDPASPFDETERYRVVGVVDDFVQGSLSRPSRSGFITTSDTIDSVVPRVDGISLVVRTRSDPGLLLPEVDAMVQRMFPWANRTSVMTGRQLVEADLGRQRLGASFFVGFGGVSLLLGFGGVFGLVAYLAESRMREFGVRLALGATPAELMRRVAATGLVPVIAGTCVGLVVAALLSSTFAAFTYGVGGLDPKSYVLVTAVMIGGAVAAGLIAALRVRRASPMQALRAE